MSIDYEVDSIEFWVREYESHLRAADDYTADPEEYADRGENYATILDEETASCVTSAIQHAQKAIDLITVDIENVRYFLEKVGIDPGSFDETIASLWRLRGGL